MFTSSVAKSTSRHIEEAVRYGNSSKPHENPDMEEMLPTEEAKKNVINYQII